MPCSPPSARRVSESEALWAKAMFYVHGHLIGDTTMGQVSVGFQAGGKAYSQIIFFQDKRALEEFESGTFEFARAPAQSPSPRALLPAPERAARPPERAPARRMPEPPVLRKGQWRYSRSPRADSCTPPPSPDRSSPTPARREIKSPGRHMKSEKKLWELVNDVEELLAELRDEHGPEVAELRERIDNSLKSTKAAIGLQSERTAARLGRYVDSFDSYIINYPRLAFATASWSRAGQAMRAGSRRGDLGAMMRRAPARPAMDFPISAIPATGAWRATNCSWRSPSATGPSPARWNVRKLNSMIFRLAGLPELTAAARRAGYRGIDPGRHRSLLDKVKARTHDRSSCARRRRTGTPGSACSTKKRIPPAARIAFIRRRSPAWSAILPRKTRSFCVDTGEVTLWSGNWLRPAALSASRARSTTLRWHGARHG